jgi:hypothetical protein
MHLMKYIQKYKTPVKSLHVSAPRCHHQGIILTKKYKASALNYVLCRLHYNDLNINILKCTKLITKLQCCKFKICLKCDVAGRSHDKCVPVTTAWRVLGLRIEERPPDVEGSCE